MGVGTARTFYVHRQGGRLMRLHQIAADPLGYSSAKESSHARLDNTQSKHQYDSLSLVLSLWPCSMACMILSSMCVALVLPNKRDKLHIVPTRYVDTHCTENLERLAPAVSW